MYFVKQNYVIGSVDIVRSGTQATEFVFCL
jgi:hypothetical protein